MKRCKCGRDVVENECECGYYNEDKRCLCGHHMTSHDFIGRCHHYIKDLPDTLEEIDDDVDYMCICDNFIEMNFDV